MVGRDGEGRVWRQASRKVLHRPEAEGVWNSHFGPVLDAAAKAKQGRRRAAGPGAQVWARTCSAPGCPDMGRPYCRAPVTAHGFLELEPPSSFPGVSANPEHWHQTGITKKNTFFKRPGEALREEADTHQGQAQSHGPPPPPPKGPVPVSWLSHGLGLNPVSPLTTSAVLGKWLGFLGLCFVPQHVTVRVTGTKRGWHLMGTWPGKRSRNHCRLLSHTSPTASVSFVQ